MKRIPIFIFLSIFLLSSVIAAGCDEAGFMGTGIIGEDFTVTVTCPTCTFLNITFIKDPFSNIIESNTAFTANSSDGFIFIVNGSDTGTVGTYFVEGFSNLDTPLKACFDITVSGNVFDNLWMNFILVFLLSAGAFTLVYAFNESKNVRGDIEGNFVYYYLGAFMLLGIGVYTIIWGFGGYQNILTESFAYIIWGSGLFFLVKPYYIGSTWKW